MRPGGSPLERNFQGGPTIHMQSNSASRNPLEAGTRTPTPLTQHNYPTPKRRPVASPTPYRNLLSSSSTNSRGLSLSQSSSTLSPKQESEIQEFELRLGQRQVLLQRMSSKRELARQNALSRREGYWLQRHFSDVQEARMKRLCDAALNKPIAFLPRLPRAAEMARETWARQDTLESPRTSSAARNLVQGLSDGTAIVSTVVVRMPTTPQSSARVRAFDSWPLRDVSDTLVCVRLSNLQSAWQKPAAGKIFTQNMKQSTADARGLAPQARHFKQASVLAVKDMKLEAVASMGDR